VGGGFVESQGSHLASADGAQSSSRLFLECDQRFSQGDLQQNQAFLFITVLRYRSWKWTCPSSNSKRLSFEKFELDRVQRPS
jgi:hypothetical protein